MTEILTFIFYFIQDYCNGDSNSARVFSDLTHSTPSISSASTTSVLRSEKPCSLVGGLGAGLITGLSPRPDGGRKESLPKGQKTLKKNSSTGIISDIVLEGVYVVSDDPTCRLSLLQSSVPTVYTVKRM